MVADVLFAEQFVEVVALEHGFYLRVDAGKDDGNVLFLRHEAHVLQVMKTSGVNKWNLTHADEADLGGTAVAGHDDCETVT